MSSAVEDWKRFEQFSDKMVVTDLTTGRSNEIVLGGVKPGEWVSFCEYDDEFESIRRILLGTENIVEKAVDRKKRSPKERKNVIVEELELDGGVFCVFDKAFYGKWPLNFRLDKPNSKLVEMWGEPDDESKSDMARFFELGWHLSLYPDCDRPRIESGKFGIFGGMFGTKKLRLVVMRDSDTFEVEGIEVIPDA